jgi:hypothetical protein
MQCSPARVQHSSLGGSVAQYSVGCSAPKLGCGVAHLESAWLSIGVTEHSGYSVAQLGCSHAQLVVRWPAVRQA